MKINIWTLYSKDPLCFHHSLYQNPDGVNRNRHKSLEHLDEGDREVDVGGVKRTRGKGSTELKWVPQI